MAVIHWAEIEAFHNVRKHMGIIPAYGDPDLLHGKSAVTYHAKVKLHGTNSAIQCHSDGRVVAQSRTTELVNGNDNAGFAAWVRANENHWKVDKSPRGKQRADMVIYGEWIGPGIQKGVAVSSIPKKVFAVFAAKPMGAPNPHTVMYAHAMADGSIVEDPEFAGSNTLVVEPDALMAMVHDLPDTYVLPWYGKPIVVDWSKSNEDLAQVTNQINEWVKRVEEVDPWVERHFGVKGTGEGLVFYPISKEHLGADNFANLAFKAKGEAHRVTKQSAPVQVSAQAAASIDQFIDLVLTESRLQQGVSAVSGNNQADMKLTGKFVAWVWADVQKENQDELDASQLEWKQVQKPLSDKARAWYLAEAKK